MQNEISINTLVIKPGGLGDTLLTLPLIRALRQQSAQVEVMGSERYWSVAVQSWMADRAVS